MGTLGTVYLTLGAYYFYLVNNNYPLPTDGVIGRKIIEKERIGDSVQLILDPIVSFLQREQNKGEYDPWTCTNRIYQQENNRGSKSDGRISGSSQNDTATQKEPYGNCLGNEDDLYLRTLFKPIPQRLPRKLKNCTSELFNKP